MNLGLPEMIFIFLLALIIFGPKKMPEIGRQIGRALNEFKRASNEFKSQIESEISQLDVTETKQQILPPAQPPAGSVVTGLTPAEEAPPAPVEPPAPVPFTTESNTPAKAPDA
ncbi:MAG: TatA/E family twin arginine-targeting protein translocase [Acidobacteriia bacterium]|nr:TatA/E family twin arginine-targeting protein translocase [Terriglobia bacterium]